jgi:dienelactone hydrolase
MWNVSGVDPAAYIAMYPECNTSFIGDTDVSDHPIRMFHGLSDDWVPIGSCRAYFSRLQHTAKDVQMVEYPDTSHAFDYPNVPSTPIAVANAQAMICSLKEEPLGTILNTETQKPFSYSDACVKRNPHIADSAASTHSTEDTVKPLLKAVFKLQ